MATPWVNQFRNLGVIYILCGVWCTVGLVLLVRDLSLFRLLPSTLDPHRSMETAWICGPLACATAYFGETDL
jgi:hypothetical protein